VTRRGWSPRRTTRVGPVAAMHGWCSARVRKLSRTWRTSRSRTLGGAWYAGRGPACAQRFQKFWFSSRKLKIIPRTSAEKWIRGWHGDGFRVLTKILVATLPQIIVPKYRWDRTFDDVRCPNPQSGWQPPFGSETSCAPIYRRSQLRMLHSKGQRKLLRIFALQFLSSGILSPLSITTRRRSRRRCPPAHS